MEEFKEESFIKEDTQHKKEEENREFCKSRRKDARD